MAEGGIILATYFVCSACGTNDLFACEVYRFPQTVTNPDAYMVPKNEFAPPDKHNRILYKAAYIDSNLYADSITRRMRWRQTFGGVIGTRFHLNFGRYAVLKYLITITNPSDVIVVGSPIYIASLVRGTMMPIDQYEQDLIDMCYKYNIYFSGNSLGPELKHDLIKNRIYEAPLSTKAITESDLIGWIHT